MNRPGEIIEIVVMPSGETTVRAKGFAGGSCRDATKELERALGQVTGEQLTPEFYLDQSAHQENRTQN